MAREYNLMGQTEAEQIRIDILENQITDINNTLYQLVYERNPNAYDNLKKQFLSNLPQLLEEMSKFLGGNPFFLLVKQ